MTDTLHLPPDVALELYEAAKECEYCWGQCVESLGPPQKGWFERLERALPKLKAALANAGKFMRGGEPGC